MRFGKFAKAKLRRDIVRGGVAGINDTAGFAQRRSVCPFKDRAHCFSRIALAPGIRGKGPTGFRIAFKFGNPALKLRKAANGFYYVNGTPTDCVHLAVTGMLDHQPDMVVSGINAGANMGDDTIYSGTVAAATEGFLLGIPAIALSLVGKDFNHYETAAKAAVELVQKFATQKHAQPWLLNVNVPDVPYEKLHDTVVTRLGRRHKAEPVIKALSPHGETVYWVGAAGKAQDAGEGTDFDAVAQQRVSITPLQIDLTQYNQIDSVRSWITHE